MAAWLAVAVGVETVTWVVLSLFAVMVAAATRAAGSKKQVLAMAPSGSRRVVKYGGAMCLVDAFVVVAAASEVRGDRPTALAAGGYW